MMKMPVMRIQKMAKNGTLRASRHDSKDN